MQKIDLSDLEMAQLREQLGRLPEPRGGRRQLHPLPTVLTLALAATLAGARGYLAISEYAARLTQTHLLAALFPRQGTVLAQRAVEAKHNEIPALRELLDPLSIEGRVITADALHTQRETAHFLVEEKGAHYLFTVKDNQKTLANDLKAFDWESIPP